MTLRIFDNFLVRKSSKLSFFPLAYFHSYNLIFFDPLLQLSFWILEKFDVGITGPNFAMIVTEFAKVLVLFYAPVALNKSSWINLDYRYDHQSLKPQLRWISGCHYQIHHNWEHKNRNNIAHPQNLMTSWLHMSKYDACSIN